MKKYRNKNILTNYSKLFDLITFLIPLVQIIKILSIMT